MEKEPRRRKVNITKDKKQTRVSIPSDLVLEFEIDSSKDEFEWFILEDEIGISLSGRLLKGSKK